MKQLILLLMVVVMVAGCQRNAPSPVQSGQKESVRDVLNFQSLIAQVQELNGPELAKFHENWGSIRSSLNQYLDDGQLNDLPKTQREELWWALEYLRSCRHPDILHQHGKEIETILFRIDLPELNDQLRQILADFEESKNFVRH